MAKKKAIPPQFLAHIKGGKGAKHGAKGVKAEAAEPVKGEATETKEE